MWKKERKVLRESWATLLQMALSINRAFSSFRIIENAIWWENEVIIIIYTLKINSPSLDIPAAMHFFSLQYWQRLRLMRRMLHCWFLVQGLYWIFCWMDRRKNPCKRIKYGFSTQYILLYHRPSSNFIVKKSEHDSRSITEGSGVRIVFRKLHTSWGERDETRMCVTILPKLWDLVFHLLLVKKNVGITAVKLLMVCVLHG